MTLAWDSEFFLTYVVGQIAFDQLACDVNSFTYRRESFIYISCNNLLTMQTCQTETLAGVCNLTKFRRGNYEKQIRQRQAWRNHR